MGDFSHSEVLFINEQGSSMRFYMRPGPLKIRLKPLIEHGGGAVVSRCESGVLRLVEKESAALSVGREELTLYCNYIEDCVKKNCQLPFDDYTVKLSTFEVSDFSQTQDERKSRSRLTTLSDTEQKITDYILEHADQFVKLSNRGLYEKLQASGIEGNYYLLHKTIDHIYSNVDSYVMKPDQKKKLKKLFSQKKKKLGEIQVPEELDILNYIDTNNRYKDVNGTALWEQMSLADVTSHSAKAAKKIFLCRIMKNIYDYDLPLSQIKKLFINVGAQNTDPNDQCSSSSDESVNRNENSPAKSTRSAKRLKLYNSPVQYANSETESITKSPNRRHTRSQFKMNAAYDDESEIIQLTGALVPNLPSRSTRSVALASVRSDMVSPFSDISYKSAAEEPHKPSSTTSDSSFHSTVSDIPKQQMSPSMVEYTRINDDLMVEEVEVFSSNEHDVTVVLDKTKTPENSCIEETPSDQINKQDSNKESVEDRTPIPNSAWLDTQSDSEHTSQSSASLQLNTQSVSDANWRFEPLPGADDESISLHSIEPNPPNAQNGKDQMLQKEILEELQDGDPVDDCLPLLSQQAENSEVVPSSEEQDDFQVFLSQTHQPNLMQKGEPSASTQTLPRLLHLDFGSQESSQGHTLSQNSQRDASYIPIQSRLVFIEQTQNTIKELEAISQDENLNQDTKEKLKLRIHDLNYTLCSLKLTSSTQEILLKPKMSIMEKATLVNYLAKSGKVMPQSILKNVFGK